MKDKILLVGGGGHCKSVIDVILATNKYEIVGIVDMPEKIGQEVAGIKIIGADNDLPELRKIVDKAIITVGFVTNNNARVKIYHKLKELNFILPVIISPLAYVSRYATIGEGTVVMHHALINANAKIGVNCIINTKSLIEHDAIVGDHSHISTAAVVNGGVVIADNTFLGSNATTIQTRTYKGFLQASNLHKGQKMLLKDYQINQNTKIIDVLQLLEKNLHKILFVIDNNEKVIGTITDGDVRRYILKYDNLLGLAKEACQQNFLYIDPSKDKEQIYNLAQQQDIKAIPVLDDKHQLLEIIFIDDNKKKVLVNKSFINCPIVIMAGGQGTRLEPFTKILPKPLIPVNDKTILEIIIDKFNNFGFDDFYITINYKGYIIKSYLAECNFPFDIKYIEETKPLGTAGALSLLKNEIKEKFFILTNCDIIIDIDYLDLIKFHLDNKNDITVVASAKNYKIPYGVCKLDSKGELNTIDEKPEYNFLVNTGMYIINTNLLNLIPDNTFYHATHLIEDAKNNGYKVSIFPVSENAWIDIGEWEEYRKTLSKFNL